MKMGQLLTTEAPAEQVPQLQSLAPGPTQLHLLPLHNLHLSCVTLVLVSATMTQTG